MPKSLCHPLSIAYSRRSNAKCETGESRRWDKTKLQHCLTQGQISGPVFEVPWSLDSSTNKLATRSFLVRDWFVPALSYVIEQHMGEHRHDMNRLMARILKHFHKPANLGRRDGVNWLTAELQGLYNKIQLVHRNEQTIHQKALDEMAQKQVISCHSWDLLKK